MSSNTVVIEHCKNCKQHQWNTRHDESKYLGYFKEFKAAFEKEGLKVEHAKTSRLGSFEILLDGVVLFSKLKAGMFPDVHTVVDYVMEFREQMKNTDDRNEVINKYSEQVNNLSKTALSFSSRSPRHSLSPSKMRNTSSYFSSKKFIKAPHEYQELFKAENLLHSRLESREKGKQKRFFASTNLDKSLEKKDSEANPEMQEQHHSTSVQA